MRPTYAEIDLGAVRHNVAALRSATAPAALCAVVKADGYGHGDAPVAEAALEAGAERLAVALVEEGVRLREAGIEAPILVLSEPDYPSVPDVGKWGLTPTAYSQSMIEALGELAPDRPVHIKIDTGMHRVGSVPETVPHLIDVALGVGLEVEGLWTHFAVADEDPVFTRAQFDRFMSTVEPYEPPMRHLANTAGALLFPEARQTFSRIGLGMYGLHPCDETRDLVELRPAMRIVTHVSQVRRLEAGARPSYGRVRALEGAASVATAPIGYADGFSRRLSESGVALIGGSRFPLAGMVTMDQIVIDVGDAEVEQGDEVVVLGEQLGAEVTADDWARDLGTISYEVVCGIGPRVPRRYLS